MTAFADTAPLPVRYLDLVLIVALLPLVVLADLPLLGYLVGAGAWTAQRLLGTWLDARAAASADVKRSVGIMLAGVMGRAWLMGLTILAVGLAGAREDGLMAALLVFFAFTVYLALSLILRPQRKSSS
ncbi:MAG TPA: hypothetical protein VM266_02495 [Solirubrobacteraceae bacterium]|nr:hypothetical protein [Solirubrobacteraceae bacterium]